MVQFRPFRCKLRNALQHTHLQSAVRECDAEEYAFEFAVCLLVLLRLADAFLQLLALYLLVALVYKSVVFGFEVGGQTYFGLFVSLPKCRRRSIVSRHMEPSEMV